MNKRFILTKIIFMILLILTTQRIHAAVYYSCEGATYTFSGFTLQPGETVNWDVLDASNNSIPGFPAANPPTTLPTVGRYKVVMVINSSNGCASDPVENIVYVLPAIKISLTIPNTAYCAGAALNTTLTATLTQPDGSSLPALPTGISYRFDWYKTIDATGNNIGGNSPMAPSTINANQSTLVIPGITVAGSYFYSAFAEYDISNATESGTWIGTGCKVFANTSHEIKVLPTPTQPTIIITAS